jgi:hypothetical protein
MLYGKRSVSTPRWRYTLPLLYGVIVLAGTVIYFYLDRRSHG